MCAQPVPEWLDPPPEGFTAGDLDRLPALPAHAQLIDGRIVLAGPQSILHALAVDLFHDGLRACCPPELRALRGISMVLDDRQRPVPDLLVIEAGSRVTVVDSGVPAQDVELVVEIVSPESTVRDRQRKPQLCAQAGIPYFWRVELEQRRPVVHTYELSPASEEYKLTGTHRDRLTLTRPFPVDMDLPEIRLR